MNTNGTSPSIKDVEKLLAEAKEVLQEAVKSSLQSIKENPEVEKEFINLWTNYTKSLSDFFFLEAEKTGNDEVAKNLIKYIMFKRY